MVEVLTEVVVVVVRKVEVDDDIVLVVEKLVEVEI
jgi:hypothetical protein